MFAKLLKYEIKATAKPLLLASAVSLGLAVLNVLIFLITGIDQLSEGATAMLLLSAMQIFLGSLLLCSVAYTVCVKILLCIRFYRHHFTDQGYLTFTIPASTHQSLLTSGLNILAWNIISSVVSILSLGIIAIGFLGIGLDMHPTLKDIWSFYTTLSYSGQNGWYIAFAMVASWLYEAILPMLAITIGCLVSKKHKVLSSVGFYFAISIGVSIIVSIAETAILIGSMSVDYENYEASIAQTELYTSILLWGQNIFYIAFAVGGYFLMHHLVKKKLNL